MKKIPCIIVALTILLALCTSAAATYDDQLVMLSELSDAEIMSFLQENNIEIPDYFPDEDSCMAFIRYIIIKVEENQSVVFHYGSWTLYKLSSDIKEAVLAYYGLSEISSFSIERFDYNILQYSELTEDAPVWDNKFSGYNCYAYAVGYDDWIDPGQLKWQANNETDPFVTAMWPSVSAIAGIVKEDLEAIGYTNVSITTSISVPPIITKHDRLICLRRATGDYSSDYHFMVLESDGSWYHKPGNGVPMRYLGTPSNDDPWILEGLDSEGFFVDEDVEYDSTIYYIWYTIPCTNMRYKYCNNNQHIYTCTSCGKTSGSKIACSYSYKYANSNTHILTCTACGNTSGSAASCIYINNICKSCGHHKISGSIMKVLAEQQ